MKNLIFNQTKQIIKTLISNIILFISLYITIFFSELSLRLITNISIFEIQAYLYDLYYSIIIFIFILLFKYHVIKSLIISILSLLYCLYNFYTIMQLENDIFFSLLTNNPIMLAYQLFLCLTPFILTLTILAISNQIYDHYHDRIIYIPIMILILYLISKPMPTRIHNYMVLDYKKHPSNTHSAAVYQDKSQRELIDVIEKLGYIVADITRYQNEKRITLAHEISEEEINNASNYLESHHPIIQTNEMTGIFEGKNLIMILCESLDDSAIDKEITPTLYKLKNQGISMNNHYAPLFINHTSDSEFISLTGIYPSQEYGSTYKYFADNNYPNAIANLFKEENYKTNAFHSYLEYFYNRDSMFPSLGFDEFYGASALGIEKEAGTLSGYQGFYKDINMIIQMFKYTDTTKPFFNYFISLSGHGVYKFTRPDLQDNIKILNNSNKYHNYPHEAKSYLAAQMLLDQALAKLLDQLEINDLLDDTVICLFSDHYPYGLSEEKTIELLLDNEYEYSKYHVPFIIYNPQIQPMQINKLTSTFDIYPTLANMFGFDITNSYTIGNDVFSDNESFVFFKDGSILTDNLYYDSSFDHIIFLSDDTDTTKLNMLKEKINDIKTYGQDIIRANLLY